METRQIYIGFSPALCLQCGFDPSYSGIWGAADDVMLNKVNFKNPKKFPQYSDPMLYIIVLPLKLLAVLSLTFS